jgi:hypothetical protein
MRTIHDLSAAERRIVADLQQRVAAELGGVDFRMTLPRGMRRRTGKRQESEKHLTTATTMYHDMDMRFWLEPAEAEAKESAR